MISPLFLKPKLEDPVCFKQQADDIANYFQSAFALSQLTVTPTDGIAISKDDVSYILVERIFKANPVIVDVNPYPDSQAAPWLYYCIGVSQALPEHTTILIGRTLDHLPLSLRKQNALAYLNAPALFYKAFGTAIQSITNEGESEPDNPVREYLRMRAIQDEMERLRKEAHAKEAQIKDLESRVQGGGRSPISFRKVVN